MYRHILNLFRPSHPEKIQLGRWNLKTCEELSTSINSIYQNRDHCSDMVCKTPKKADAYMDIKVKRPIYPNGTLDESPSRPPSH